MAYIVTLSGDNSELMDGWWTDLKRSSFGKTVSSITHDSPMGYVWRPSKIGWMQPVGGAVAGIGTALSATGFGAFLGVPLMVAGSALTVGGTVGNAIHAEDQERKAEASFVEQKQLQAMKAKKQTNLMVGGAILAGIAGIYLATK